MRLPGLSSATLLSFARAALCVACLALTALSHANTLGGYYRYPALHEDTLVFVAEGDLWRVPATGGAATRLTAHPGSELLPAISRDGRTLAFTGNYDGATEIYTMPLGGGLPKRLTWEGENSIGV
ncbi:MAG TPA: hypothetical protein VGE76_21390, partial [Opitutaceae bacterium]